MYIMSEITTIVTNLITLPKFIFIVPYRNREEHLAFFKTQMEKVLINTNIQDYKILFIHQCDTRSFNRGAIKNIGFLAVKQMYPHHYKQITLVFNDVDCMPREAGIVNYVTSPGIIKHFYGYIYTLGGIVCINAGDFERIGGFPNFWNWGYEDNMLQKRTLAAGIRIDRSVFYEVYENIAKKAIERKQPLPDRLTQPIIQLSHGNLRVMNYTDFNKYSSYTRDGIASIKGLRFVFEPESECDNRCFVNVYEFDVGYVENKEKTFVHDLAKGNNPFKGRRPSNKRFLLHFG